jgi:POT family proton-dependent oligopeptide transporter
MSGITEKPLEVQPEMAAPAPTTHPRAFYFFFWGEFAERCSYYGMRTILLLFLIDVLRYEDPDATAIFNYFKAACYFLPLLGGFLADRYFGKYWTIVGFALPYVLGQFLIGVESRMTMFLALCLLAAGSGVIKPNLSTLMGLTYDQQRPGQVRLRSAAFLWFYFAINVGASLAAFALPRLRNAVIDSTHDVPFAYKVAFQVPAWLMVVALAIFALGKPRYAVEVIDRSRRSTPEERRQRWQVLGNLFGIFVLMVFFWMAYEQNDNLWTLFARAHVDRVVDLGFWRNEVPPDGFQFINPVMVLLLVPCFDRLWKRVDPLGTHFPPATKILLGFLLTACAIGIMAVAGYAARGEARVSFWYIVIAFVVLTAGEILVYGTGLELSFTAAPANLKGFVTGCFLATIGLADLINGPVSQLYGTRFGPGNFFALTAAMVLAASVAFWFVGRRFNRTAPAPAGPA